MKQQPAKKISRRQHKAIWLPLFFGAGTMIALPFLTAHSIASDTPHIDGEVIIEFAGNQVQKENEAQSSLNPTVELSMGWTFSSHWSVQGAFTLESAYEGNNDYYFKQLAFSTDALYLGYHTDLLHLFAGKITPTFGTAWDLMPGVYGSSLVEDYELAEGYLGTGVSVIAVHRFGKHILTGTAFHLDRSLLSQTAFYNTGQTSLEDGGLANTTGLHSFSLTMDSENVFGLEGIHTHLGYRKQAVAKIDQHNPDKQNETGLVASIDTSYNLSPNLKLEVMAEYADFTNYEGDKDVDANYQTLGTALALQDYVLSATYTQKKVAQTESSLLALSLGTEIWDHWVLDLGYALGKEQGQPNEHSVGFTLAKALSFSTAQ